MQTAHPHPILDEFHFGSRFINQDLKLTQFGILLSVSCLHIYTSISICNGPEHGPVSRPTCSGNTFPGPPDGIALWHGPIIQHLTYAVNKDFRNKSGPVFVCIKRMAGFAICLAGKAQKNTRIMPGATEGLSPT